MPCEHGHDTCSLSTAIACSRKNLEILIDRERRTKERHQQLFGIAPEEVKAVHQLDAYEIALSLMP